MMDNESARRIKTFLMYPYKGELELERELVDIINSEHKRASVKV